MPDRKKLRTDYSECQNIVRGRENTISGIVVTGVLYSLNYCSCTRPNLNTAIRAVIAEYAQNSFGGSSRIIFVEVQAVSTRTY